jgi:paraquat-inducible protein B
MTPNQPNERESRNGGKNTSGRENRAVAIVERDRSLSAAWLVAIAAIGLAGYLAWSGWNERGETLEVRFASGNGISQGDDVRYRGIVIGRVEDLRLETDGTGVVVEVECDADVAAMAGAETRFWVVRPRLDLGGVTGLDTVVGPRYLETRPAGEPAVRAFRGLDEAPVVEEIADGDLLLVLEAADRGSLRRRAAVRHRGVEVGKVLSVDLAEDGRRVEAEVLIRAPHADLVGRDTKFFQIGAVEVGLSLDGLRTRIDSLETLLLGGVGFATPEDGDAGVADGARFELHDAPEEEWLEW